MFPKIDPAWLTAIVAIITLGVTTTTQFILKFWSDRADRRREILRVRADALLAALTVIDRAFENISFHGLPPARPDEWDERLGRDTMNRLLVYCADPERTVELFRRALGLRHPDQERYEYGTTELAAFRAQVRRELGFKTTSVRSADYIWIYRLTGSISARNSEFAEVNATPVPSSRA